MEKLNEILKKRRNYLLLSIKDLAAQSGVSPSHISRIERGARYPSATILSKLCKPLGLSEKEMYILAGFLSYHPSTKSVSGSSKQLDPYVAIILGQEPVAVQRAVVRLLKLAKLLAASSNLNLSANRQ